MPLVRIDVLESRTPEELASIADGVHRALVEAIGIPPQDRFQVLRRHPESGLVFDRHYLGIARTDGVVYQSIVRNLAEKPGVRTEDVFVNLVEVVKENWSFGNGIAQYAS
jgi:phenylpyruvate tautomerase PptA (4-oxalocrotonate tautomerase family)